MCFTGSPIDRSAALLKQKTKGFFAGCLASPSTQFLLLHCGRALCRSVNNDQAAAGAVGVLTPRWLSLDELLGAGVRLELPPDVVKLGHRHATDVAGNAITVLLGYVSAAADDGAEAGWRVAVEWGKHSDDEAAALQCAASSEEGEQLSWCGGRELYHRLAWTDAAVVGHAVCATS